jgi:hypothetical protein
MSISGLSGIPYGQTMRQEIGDAKLPAVNNLVSDGRVDDAFVQSDPSFIGDIEDSRIKEFLTTNKAPGADWKAHKLGGFDSAHQSLFTDNGQAVLRTTITQGGDDVKHIIKAPYDATTGVIHREDSTEGFSISAPAAKSLTFLLRTPQWMGQ